MKKILIIFLLLFPLVTFAGGIEVRPSKIDLNISASSPVSSDMTIINPTADVQIFEVYADDFQEIITLYPSSFTLEAGASQNVLVTVQPKDFLNTSRILNTQLSVVSSPLANSRFQANTGIKIPITVTITENESRSYHTQWLFFFFIILAGLFSVFTLLRRKRK